MKRWYAWWGPEWAIQIDFARPFAFGFHVEPRTQRTAEGVTFGPYADLHLPFVVLSVGRNPIHAGDLDRALSYAKAFV